MRPPIPDSPEFNRLLLGDEDADLTRIALELARDADPDLDPASCLDRIASLSRRIGPRLPSQSGTEDALRQINWVLYVEERFSGNEDDYDDPRNSYLNEVLRRRTGIPISLAVLYRAVALGVGVTLHGVNLPAHFVLRADRDDGPPVFIDAFHGGALLDRDGCRRLISSRSGGRIELDDALFEPCATSDIVARMLRNLKAVYLDRGELAAAWPVLRRLVALRPGEPEHRRDLGIASLAVERPEEAVAQLSAYLEQVPQASDSPAIRSILREARRRSGRSS
ncbi:tetratricopeptide repeat protein [Tautonia sociabilis]|uniref:Tetratricopeptide repeat protein n=1 Tax=Tautonia sociabilis TaxID=2080755 RepID=A0A432MQ92_9BACT|nr:tetratricopeptide repeat protein [Tautonia sociabilis]